MPPVKMASRMRDGDGCPFVVVMGSPDVGSDARPADVLGGFTWLGWLDDVDDATAAHHCFAGEALRPPLRLATWARPRFQTVTGWQSALSGIFAGQAGHGATSMTCGGPQVAQLFGRVAIVVRSTIG